jgi:hypothetical protein
MEFNQQLNSIAKSPSREAASVQATVRINVLLCVTYSAVTSGLGIEARLVNTEPVRICKEPIISFAVNGGGALKTSAMSDLRLSQR